MILHRLTLLNFKNYGSATLDFDKGVNCFTGNNGSGKTNLLDAIHYLAMTKSYFHSSDIQNIKHGEQIFVLQGEFDIEGGKENIFCGLKINQKKQFKRENKEYARMSDHIGLLPVVMIAPVDHALITEGSEDRRRFIDSIISQVDKGYLDDLIHYNRILAQRNALLKQLSKDSKQDIKSITVWNEQLVIYGQRIFEMRELFLQEFIPVFISNYKFLSDGNEEVSIAYNSHLHDGDFALQLENNLQKDLVLQFTTKGIHKDDLEFKIFDHPVKRIGSQGQQKTFLLALKLAQFDFLAKKKHTKPVLLLDDIFDKLDDSRVKKLMELVVKNTFGQLFITDTHPERLKTIFNSIDVDVKVFPVISGTV